MAIMATNITSAPEGCNGQKSSRPCRVTINCDMGEAYGTWKMGPDEDLMPLIDIANVACGFHGGDPVVMHKTIKLAKKHGVLVGAHPSLPDREGFGRRYIDISPSDLFDQLVYQIGAVEGMLRAEQMKLHHVKTHGYLWRMCQNSDAHCRAVMDAVKVFDTRIMVIAGTKMETMATEMGFEVIPEFYPDIHYNENGQLMSILRDGRVPQADIMPKVLRVLEEDTVVPKSGGPPAQMKLAKREFSCCIHSDLPGPLETLTAVREAIRTARPEALVTGT